MSTSSKLNPKIRQARSERKGFLRFLLDAADFTTDFGRMAASTLERVQRIVKDPKGTAESKNARFDAALRFYAAERAKLEPQE